MSRRYPHALLPLEIGLIRSAYREGLSLQQIATALNRSKSVISRTVKKSGLSRPRGPNPIVKPRMTSEQIRQLRLALEREQANA